MIVYEVNLLVDRGIAAEYLSWLRAHVAQMLALPGFVDAELFEVEGAEDATSPLSLCAQYRMQDAAALDAYLREFAPRMRAAGVARFGDRFSAQRRVLRPIDVAP